MTANIGDYVSAYRFGTLYPVFGVLIHMSRDGKCHVASVRDNYYAHQQDLVKEIAAAEHPYKKSEEWLPDYEQKFVAATRKRLQKFGELGDS